MALKSTFLSKAEGIELRVTRDCREKFKKGNRNFKRTSEAEKNQGHTIIRRKGMKSANSIRENRANQLRQEN